MQHDFERIRKEYCKRRGGLLLKGRSQHPTAHGYWAASDPDVIFELFKKLELHKYRSFVDLGSGDGIVAAIASLFTRSTGIEADSALHNSAEEIKKILVLSHILKNKDYLEEDLSGYDVIFINPGNHFHQLERKLVSEFKGLLVITDNLFAPLTLDLSERIGIMGVDFSIYRI